MRCAIYARVSTLDQEPENQLPELRDDAAARGWSAEYTDRGVSGAKDSRPALDRLLADARRRKLDVVLCWRLDRIGRNSAPRHPARGTGDGRGGICQLGRRHRRDDASREAATAHPRDAGGV
jgi:resolvase-like protein